MIEVLVTIVILTIGLLGLAGLQARLQVSEMESYQRAQALILLEDMAHRITSNRSANYVLGIVYGEGMDCPAETATTLDRDVSEWCNTLKGVAETKDGANIGAMIGARGCIQSTAAGEYLVTVAWQGLAPIGGPPEGVTCGANQYDGGACAGDRCRRTVTTIVRIGTLL